jgi:hypothetical protein
MNNPPPIHTHTHTHTQAHIPTPAHLPRAPFAPLDPSATQSLQAACISTTNACPSALSAPCCPYECGLTTGVSQPVEVKCVRSEVPLVEVALVADRAFRDRSAIGRWECSPQRSESRYTVLARSAVEEASKKLPGAVTGCDA